MLDYPIHKRLSAVRIAQIEAGPGAQDLVVADDPTPRGRLGGNGIRLLPAVLSHQSIALNADVVSDVLLVALSADSKRAWYPETVDAQVFDCDITAVKNIDCVIFCFTRDDCGRTRIRTGNRHPRGRCSVQTDSAQSRVCPRLHGQGAAWLQIA